MTKSISSVLILALLGSAAASTARAQTKTAADGPWAGWAQCNLTVLGQNYVNQQTHTWALTGATPKLEGEFRLFPATWTVVGQGSHRRDFGGGRTALEQWTTSGPPVTAPLSVWIRKLDYTVRFTIRHSPLRSPGAATGTSTSHSITGTPPDQTTPISYEVYEWTFPAIDQVDADKITVAGSSTPQLTGSIAPGQPPKTTGSASCSWQFVRGGALASAPPPPPTAISVASTPPAAPVTISGVGPASTIQVAPTTSVPTESTPATRSSTTSSAALPTRTTGMTSIAPTAPGGPAASGLSTRTTSSSIELRWSCPPGASGFEVLATPRGGSQVKLTATPISPSCPQALPAATSPGIPTGGTAQTTYSTGFSHTGLSSDSEFTYVVRTLYPAGGPADSNPLTAVTDLAPPVTGVTTRSGEDGTVYIFWPYVGNGPDHVVLRKLAGETAFRQMARVGWTESMYFETFVPVGRHEYKVHLVGGDPGAPIPVDAGSPYIWQAAVNGLEVDLGFDGVWYGGVVRVMAAPQLSGPFTDVTATGSLGTYHWYTTGTPGSTLHYKVVATYPGATFESAPTTVSILANTAAPTASSTATGSSPATGTIRTAPSPTTTTAGATGTISSTSPPGGSAVGSMTFKTTSYSIGVRWPCQAGAGGYELFVTPKGGTQSKLTPTPINPNCVQDLTPVTSTTIALGGSSPTYSTGFNHTGLPPASEFTYMVRTLYPGGGPADSKLFTARTGLTPPITGVLTQNAGDGTVYVMWPHVGLRGDYLVLRKLAGEAAFRQVARVPWTESIYVDKGLPVGRHEYVVRADSGEAGAPVAIDAGAPAIWQAAVRLVTIDLGFSGMWTGGVVRVMASPLLSGTFTDVTATGKRAGDQHWDALTDPGSRVYYKIAVTYPGGVKFESAATEVVVPVPPPLGNFTAIAGTGSVALNWNCDPAVKEYNIIRIIRGAGTVVSWDYLRWSNGLPLWVFSYDSKCSHTDRSLPAGVAPAGIEYIVVGINHSWDPIRAARAVAR